MATSSESRWLCEAWAAHVGPAVSAMTGQPATASPTAGPHPQAGSEGLLIWRQPYNAAPGAEVWIVISASVWQEVGGLVLSSAGLEDADAEEIRGTFLEVLQQSLSPLCPVMGKRLQREVQTQAGEAMERLPESEDWSGFQVQVSGKTVGTVWAVCSAALAHALAPPRHAEVVQGEDPPNQKASKTMDLLMEVELPVGVSFGRAQMRLKDAIKLTTGSIVELNRSVSEPVEIIVNNCVIARGEVVVVEGNYGVRIKHIVSREERLRTLF